MPSAPPEHLPAIVARRSLFRSQQLIFSFRTPRKGFLLPTAILLNLPLAGSGSVRTSGAVDTLVSHVLYYLVAGVRFVCGRSTRWDA